MALDTTLTGWLREIRHAGEAQKPYLDSLREQKRAYVGRSYKAGFGKMQPDNHALEYISIMRGNMLMGTPRVKWESWSDNPEAQIRALARTYSCNTWARRTRMRDLLEALMTDWAFKWCVCHVTSEPQPGFEDADDAPYWPSAKHVSLGRFRYDPAALRPQQRAWAAHLTIASRSKLMELAKDERSHWNAQAIEGVKNVNVGQFREEGLSIPERDELAYWTIWAPDVQLDAGKKDKRNHGTIFTVGAEQQVGIGWIRKPFPWFGPPQGPYVMSGDLLVPDEATPLGPLTATKHSEEHLNRISRATARAIEAYKNVVAVKNGSNLPDIVKDGKDLYVYSTNLEDLSKGILPFSIGGATEQHFAAKQDARDALDRGSGITDLMRGSIDPRNKATQEALAAQSAASRAGYPVSKFRENVVAEIFRRVGYFFDLDENVEIDVGPQAEGILPSTKLKGGLAKGQDPMEILQSDLSVEVGSMERDLEADTMFRLNLYQQTLAEIQAIGPIGSLFIDVQAILDAKAQMTGVREIARLVDVSAMRMLGMMMIQQDPAGAGQSGGATPAPTYSRTAQTGGSGPKQPAIAGGMAKKASTGSGGSGPASKALRSGGAKSAKRPANAGA